MRGVCSRSGAALAWIVCGAAVALAADRSAGAEPIRDDELMRQVALLEDGSYERRELATRKLLELGLDRAEIYELLEHRSLTPEQRQRLIAIFREQVFRTPRGAVGIRMDWSLRAPGGPGEVVITDVIEGLPAEGVLELGDRISHVDGKPLMERDDLVIRVQRKQPGDTVSLRVHRPRRDELGKLVLDAGGRPVFDTIEATLQLGSAEMLIDQRTGLPQRGGPVEADRIREAVSMAREYARPRYIEIRGAEQSLSSEELDVRVELHAAIRMIRTELRLIDDRRLEITPVIRGRWDHQLGLLEEQLAEDDLEPEERLYLEKVTALYRTLSSASP